MSDGMIPAEPGLAAPRPGNAQALLHEMLRLLQGLHARGEGGSIDLRSVPLTVDDLANLRAVLGTGAVDARVEALGESRACETRFPGIWWVTHRNEAGETVAEAIEICAIPAILCTPVDDMADGAERLRQALAETVGEGP
jgi:hydrogenase-1 operon protein HyaF